MGVYVIGQATGHHGWGALACYLSGARARGHVVMLIRPRAVWGATALEDDDCQSTVLLCLCRVDWHYQPLCQKVRDDSSGHLPRIVKAPQDECVVLPGVLGEDASLHKYVDDTSRREHWLNPERLAPLGTPDLLS